MNVFAELSLIIVIATIVAGVMRILKQPLIMGHILTGLIIGHWFFGISTAVHTFEVFAQIGISILLFIVGLGLSPKIVREVGKVAVIMGIGQITITSAIGFLLALGFGFMWVEALFIALALTLSSTIIVVKLLSDKKDTQKLYGQISIGFLLVQDVVATIALVFISALSQSGNVGSFFVLTLAKGVAMTAVLVVISSYILPRLGGFLAASQEYLFLFSIGWGLGMATLFTMLGFSIEIGALVAGITLSVSPYAQEITAKMKPLRDFFIILFFVLLGSKMVVSELYILLIPTVIFSVFVLIGNPIIVMGLLGFLGYNKKTGFMAGLTVAQISEFSLVLMLLGQTFGYVSNTALSVVTLVGLCTIAGSNYIVLYADKIYARIGKYLTFFEREKTRNEKRKKPDYEVILFGCNRTGRDFIEAFAEMGKKFLAVDFDPKIIKKLTDAGIQDIYGDEEDSEFLEELDVAK